MRTNRSASNAPHMNLLFIHTLFIWKTNKREGGREWNAQNKKTNHLIYVNCEMNILKLHAYMLFNIFDIIHSSVCMSIKYSLFYSNLSKHCNTLCSFFKCTCTNRRLINTIHFIFLLNYSSIYWITFKIKL